MTRYMKNLEKLVKNGKCNAARLKEFWVRNRISFS